MKIRLSELRIIIDETVKEVIKESQPEDFYRAIGATHLNYHTINDVLEDYLDGVIDDYTAAQALAYGIDVPMDWDDAMILLDEWDAGVYDEIPILDKYPDS